MTTIITRESLQAMLDTAEPEKAAQIVGRALVVLLRNQTLSEASSNTTCVNNGVGFTGADAYGGSLTAKYYLKHRTLLEWQVARWTRKASNGYARLTKYHKQLDAAAQTKVK